MLDLATVLALSQVCAPSVAPQTLAAIAHVESRFDPLAIGVNDGGRRPTPPHDAREAVRTATNLLANGANIDLGLAQINSGNLAWLGLTVEQAFDPCRNLEAAATVLHAGYRVTGNTPSDQQAALRIALSRYNTGDAHRGFRNGYVRRVEAAAAKLGLAAPAAPHTETGGAPLRVTINASTQPPVWDVFARPRADLLVFSSPAER